MNISQYNHIPTDILKEMIRANKKQMTDLQQKITELDQKTAHMNVALAFRNPYNPYGQQK